MKKRKGQGQGAGDIASFFLRTGEEPSDTPGETPGETRETVTVQHDGSDKVQVKANTFTLWLIV